MMDERERRNIMTRAIQHFGELRDLGHFGHGQALVGQQLGGAAGGQQLDAQRVQRLREFDDAGLVGDGEECVHGGGAEVLNKNGL